MSSLSTLPKGDSAWLLRKAVERIMQQVSVLETNIGSSTTGNSANTQVIFNDAGTLRGDAGLTYNAATDTLSAGSATITGDLTVDTSTLKVDSANDRVGVGTASPAAGAKLSVLGTTVVSASDFPNASTWSARFQAAANSQPSGIFLSGLASGGQVVPGSLHVEPVAASSRSALIATYSADSGIGYFAINRFSPSAGTTSQHFKIADDGVATWSNVGGTSGTAMTLNANGLGIGVTPSANGEKLNANGTIISTNQSIGGFALNQAGFDYSTSTKNLRIFSGTSNATGSSMSFVVGTSTSFLTALTLNSLGDFGVGITSPSYRLHSIVSSGADKNIFAAQVSGASNGFEVLWNHATTTLRVIVSNLPTSSAGLASGTLWIDTSAGNTLKVA